MKRSSVITIRVTPDCKLAWQAMSEDKLYASLTLFIEDAVNRVHFPYRAIQNQDKSPAGIFEYEKRCVKGGPCWGGRDSCNGSWCKSPNLLPDPIFHEVETDPAHLGTDGLPFKPWTNGIGGGCQYADRHRKGTYCKQCKKVI